MFFIYEKKGEDVTRISFILTMKNVWVLFIEKGEEGTTEKNEGFICLLTSTFFK
jgi:hypothetical protein